MEISLDQLNHLKSYTVIEALKTIEKNKLNISAVFGYFDTLYSQEVFDRICDLQFSGHIIFGRKAKAEIFTYEGSQGRSFHDGFSAVGGFESGAFPKTLQHFQFMDKLEGCYTANVEFPYDTLVFTELKNGMHMPVTALQIIPELSNYGWSVRTENVQIHTAYQEFQNAYKASLLKTDYRSK